MRNIIITALLNCAVFFSLTQTSAFCAQNVLLQGEVKKEVLEALTQLHEVGLAEEKIKRASEDLYQESTRPQITMEEEPDLIGETVLELPVPVQTGFVLPPRSKWVNRFMDELDKLVPMLKEEVDEIAIPNTSSAETELYNYLVSATNIVEQRYGDLKQLCAQEPYNQSAMASASATIHLAVKDMEVARKQLYERLRKAS